MAAMDLRPLSLGEILDRTFALYRRFFLLFIGISAIPQLLILGLNLGRLFTIADSFRRVRGELGNLFGVILLNGLATGVAFIFLIIPGIYVTCRLVVCIPAALIENLGPRDSLSRSFELTKDFAGRAFLILLLYFALFFGASALFAWPFTVGMALSIHNPGMLHLWTALMTVGNFVATVLVTPILMIASSIFYYDLRVRKEAFDLQILMKPLDGAVPAAGGAPIPLS